MKSNKKTLIQMAVASTFGALAMPGHAQQAAEEAAAAPASDPTTVTISGSRISSRGFTQPTPTTTLSADDLAKNAEPNVFNTVIELPALQGSTGRTTFTYSTSSGVQGLSSLSLRGLGAIRTLTLLDGQRVVGANVTGVTDISQFPQLLIKRVDVVTGGASASYGSDAIGGVVNFITDKKFQGFKSNLEGGITTYGDDKNGTLQAAWGRAFLDDRLHVVASGEYGRELGIDSVGFGEIGVNGRSWFTNPELQTRSLADTVDGKPQIRFIQHSQPYQYARYGLITNGPLQGTAFGDNGVPYQYLYGSNGVPTGTGAVTGCINPNCVGGDRSGTIQGGSNLAMNLARRVGYVRAGFDIDPDNELYFTANLARVTSAFSPVPGAIKNANLTIQCDNPFLPASIVAACASNNITSFQYGTGNGNFPRSINVHPERTQRRFVIGANGKFKLFGRDWSYDSYAEYGRNQTDIAVRDLSLNAHYNAAIDAIRGPDGTIICRNPVAVASGCKPLNIFGNVTPSAEAINYVLPPAGAFQHSVQTQKVASLNLSGEVFSNWAGAVSAATGAEYRRESYRVVGDPYGAGVSADTPNTATYPADPLLNAEIGNNWFSGNYHNAHGTYDVKEAYLELNVPVMKSASWGEANLNVADRRTRYSSSGMVSSWKLGATWQTGLDGLRLRAVTSKDVRAPNLSELYAAPVVINGTNLYQGNTLTVQQRTVGNTKLRPELARNTVFGVVLNQPAWAPGFSASLDYFDIKINGVISTLSSQQLVDLCVAGNQEICSTMVLNSPSPNGNYVTLQAFNLASLYNKGYDIEMAYRSKLNLLNHPGKLTFRVLATHTISFLTDSGVVGTIPTESAGANRGSTPRWKGLASQSWDSERASLTLTERWISSGVISNEFIECQTNCPVSTNIHQTIDNNHMPGAFYIDLGGSLKLSKGLTAYFKVNNLADIAPASAPGIPLGANPALYDLIGREYRLGLRYNY
ncbi:MAG TPA: TonB-dependent receptor plug domain-containing protein [Duganella sp.]|nr:TonB-dependent receptor plug domain-containing protein [Duganella sp.]